MQKKKKKRRSCFTVYMPIYLGISLKDNKAALLKCLQGSLGFFFHISHFYTSQGTRSIKKSAFEGKQTIDVEEENIKIFFLWL